MLNLHLVCSTDLHKDTSVGKQSSCQPITETPNLYIEDCSNAFEHKKSMGGVEVLKLSGVKHVVVAKLEKTLEEDYESIENKTFHPHQSSSLIRNRVNGAIRVKRYVSLYDFTDIKHLAHPDIATIYSIYEEMPTYVLAGEYLELNLVDLFQLTEVEIASATSQIINGFRHLSESLVGAELDEIRVSLVGRVKIGNFPLSLAKTFCFFSFGFFILPLLQLT
ncbi:hypothetical protein FOWG_18166 [Fusarium oxysporum f. sp. lycopersici MN25]|uniref:Protein kinase domain-containing protein n=1 Tax=Fusarium oxysporum f. sp. vasinfectum 25433 TaxID=1089449 RepID=X0LVT8_FUSOX|nr:hypothetical protein FOWG_18166 [Fusarium oxysporum f. sp. lycopersici MN25]EXM12615.1 hypothetical protein FOTG_18894 [Fusarium oxysporum f. sp. vasinfectum 25433]